MCMLTKKEVRGRERDETEEYRTSREAERAFEKWKIPNLIKQLSYESVEFSFLLARDCHAPFNARMRWRKFQNNSQPDLSTRSPSSCHSATKA